MGRAPRELRDRPVSLDGCTESCCEQLESENERLKKALGDIKYRLQKIMESPVLRRKIIQRNRWLEATLEIAEQALTPNEVKENE